MLYLDRSEGEPHSYLHDARIAGACNKAKCPPLIASIHIGGITRTNIAIWITELSVVEQIECLKPEF